MKSFSTQTHYEVLEISVAANAADVKSAFDRLSNLYSDDQIALYGLVDPSMAASLKQRLKEAFEVLSDDERRDAYDAKIGLPPRGPVKPKPVAQAPLRVEAPAWSHNYTFVTAVPVAQPSAPASFTYVVPAPRAETPPPAPRPVVVEPEVAAPQLSLPLPSAPVMITVEPAAPRFSPPIAAPVAAEAALPTPRLSPPVDANGAVPAPQLSPPSSSVVVPPPQVSAPVPASAPVAVPPPQVSAPVPASAPVVVPPPQVSAPVPASAPVTVPPPQVSAPVPPSAPVVAAVPPSAPVVAPSPQLSPPSSQLPTPAVTAPAPRVSPPVNPTEAPSLQTVAPPEPEVPAFAPINEESAITITRAREYRPEPRPTPYEIPEGVEINGDLLRQVRMARGITLAQLSDRMRVSVRHLENVEGDRYAQLPAGVYLRGILMNLARELGLDGVRVARSYLTFVDANRSKG